MQHLNHSESHHILMCPDLAELLHNKFSNGGMALPGLRFKRGLELLGHLPLLSIVYPFDKMMQDDAKRKCAAHHPIPKSREASKFFS